MVDFQILYPKSVEELTEYLDEYKGDCRILAGGTDLLVNIRSGKVHCKYLISLRKVGELTPEIKVQSGRLIVGALSTMSDLYRNQDVKKYFPALGRAAYLMGSQQIRNQATLAGNLCNASPAAETATPLLIYDGTIKVRGFKDRGERREIPVGDFFAGPGKTTLKANELVTEVSLPIPEIPQRSIYERISRRNGVDLAIINLSMSVDESKNLRVAYGSLGPVPYRSEKIEEALRQYIDGQIDEQALYAVIENNVSPISDLRSSAEYKVEMIKILTGKTIAQLLNEGGN